MGGRNRAASALMRGINGEYAFGALLREHRLAAGLTQAMLAERSGLSSRGIQDLERGLSQPQRDTLLRLEAALRLSPEEQTALHAAAKPTPRRRTPLPTTKRAPMSSANGRYGQPGSLPLQMTSFIGRERELADLQELLARARLVTLTGPPGTGKTRLALQVAGQTESRFADGVVFVALAAVLDGDLVLTTVAQALGLQERPGRFVLDQLIDAVSGRKLLLILDNFERLTAAGPHVAALLAVCPRLHVIVTSRELLHISGEHAYSVAPLQSDDAIRLFADRARAARADFALTTENAAAVDSICERVDRLPLAIELAASRVRLLGLDALLARLERRLPLLSGGPRDVPPRQQALRATIAWSYDLLDATEQDLFCRLGVFAGGCDIEAIRSLCGGNDVLQGVESLVEKSLLRHQPGLGGEPRYWMLETIREYAASQLQECGQHAAARGAHAAYFRALAERAEAEYFGRLDREWLDRLEQEYANMLAAIDWSLAGGEPEVGLALAGALWRFFYHRDHLTAGRDLLRRLLAAAAPAGAAAVPSPTLAKGLFAAASLAVWQGESAAGRADAEASVALWRTLGDGRGEAQALHTLAHTAMDHAAQRDLYTASVARFREMDDLRGVAWSLQCLGNVMVLLGDLDRAQEIYAETLAAARQADSPSCISGGLTGLGGLAARRSDHVRAYELYLEGLELRRAASDRALTDQLNALGRAALDMGDPRLAASHFRESLEMCRKQGIKWATCFALAGQAEVSMVGGNATRAARLFAAADRLLGALGERRSAADQAAHQCKLQAVRDALGESVFEQGWSSGRAMTTDEAIACALGEPG
jgi:predicted ATPase/DNA-binding XRE family transcriptional regulator